MSAERIVDPTVEPVSLERIYQHLHLDPTTGSPPTHPEDALLSDYITAARELIEDETGLALITQTWALTLDLFPIEIELPILPVRSIESVTYVDGNGDEQALADDQYFLDNKRKPAWLLTASGVSWPTTLSTADAVTVTMIAGFGDTADSVPKKLRHAIMLIVGDFYANREPTESSWKTIDRLKATSRVWYAGQ